MTRKLLYLSIALAAIVLGLGYLGSAWRLWALAVVGWGLLWGLAQWRRWGWFADLGLVGAAAAAAAGVWLDLPVGWMLFGLVLALLAWDLASFVGRLDAVGQVQAPELERRHLRWLLAVAGLGVALAGAALAIHFRFGLTLALFLGLLMMVGLGQLVATLRRQGD